MTLSDSNHSSPFVSFIVPMHNAMTKMSAPIESLEKFSLAHLSKELNEDINPTYIDYEVLFIDDCSTDGTYERLQELGATRPRWRILQTPTNTGSPSTPRNIGIEAARGLYVLFLDGDDELDPVGVYLACKKAAECDLDTVRGPVEIFYSTENRRVLTDRLNFNDSAKKLDKVASIARWQSLICTALWRRSLLTENSLAFDPDSRMGEDIAFTASALLASERISYVDHPLFHYVRHGGSGSSAMHHFDGNKLRELVSSWQRVEDIFQSHGLSYIQLHGASTIGYALRLIIRHHDSDSISASDIEFFKGYFLRNASVIGQLTFTDAHVSEWVSELIHPAPGNFWQAVKPRLLIAGHDLKFITPAIPYLREHFVIKVDSWLNERKHNLENSKNLLKWADYIWVEWLTAASVWYSEHVSPSQELVVRAHRYELGRSYGDEIRDSSVRAYVTIAPHCYEDLIERFSFLRSKVKFLPNYYFVDSYKKAAESDTDRVFNLAMIGYVPERKGLLKALSVLEILRREEPRYNLTLFGKSWEEMPWVRGNPSERAYFNACNEFIRKHQLEDAVHTIGWSNIYEVAKDYGFVLSTSEHEGSHVGPGEAFCAGNIGIFLPWRGAEFVYPEHLVVDSPEKMAAKIQELSEPEAFRLTANEGRKFMEDHYDIAKFVERVVGLYRSFA